MAQAFGARRIRIIPAGSTTCEWFIEGTPAELSVLVHEVVHHIQNLLSLKFECPQQRERLAYLAQERWLGLFNRSLASDFELHPLSLLVKTRCFR